MRNTYSGNGFGVDLEQGKNPLVLSLNSTRLKCAHPVYILIFCVYNQDSCSENWWLQYALLPTQKLIYFRSTNDIDVSRNREKNVLFSYTSRNTNMYSFAFNWKKSLVLTLSRFIPLNTTLVNFDRLTDIYFLSSKRMPPWLMGTYFSHVCVQKKLIIFRFGQLYLWEQLFRNLTTLKKCYYSRASVCKDDNPREKIWV